MEHPTGVSHGMMGVILLTVSWFGGIYSTMMIPFKDVVEYVPLLLSSVASFFAIRHYWLTDRKPKSSIKPMGKRRVNGK